MYRTKCTGEKYLECTCYLYDCQKLFFVQNWINCFTISWGAEKVSKWDTVKQNLSNLKGHIQKYNFAPIWAKCGTHSQTMSICPQTCQHLAEELIRTWPPGTLNKIKGIGVCRVPCRVCQEVFIGQTGRVLPCRWEAAPNADFTSTCDTGTTLFLRLWFPWGFSSVKCLTKYDEYPTQAKYWFLRWIF